MVYNRFLALFFTIFLVLCALSNKIYASGDGDIAIVEGVKPISISVAEELLNGGQANFFDANLEEVRAQYGYIPGSVFVTTESFEQMLPADKHSTIVFYCLNRLCYESSDLALKTQQKGYDNVYVMLDGIEGWLLSGRPVETYQMQRWTKPTEMKDFKDNIHSGLIFGVIPACRDCHGSDGIKAESANNITLVNTNCSSCHKEEQNDFMMSSHNGDNATLKNMLGNSASAMGGNVVSKDKDKKYPICWDCHSVHNTAQNVAWSMKQRSDKKCGSCHEEQQERYYETFHGKAMYLNTAVTVPTVAACYDCHGKHNIFKVDDPKSTLYEENRIKTCGECHEGSNKNFVSFIAHADHSNKDKYPSLYYAYIFMTCLIVIVFAFFGIHTFFWSLRLILMRLKYPEAWKKAREEAHNGKVAIRRFTLFQRFQHFFMAASFLGLSFTGLPQKFYTAPWAKAMIDFMGGPIVATKIHHISAVVMIAVFLSHIIAVCVIAWKRRDAIRDSGTGKLTMKGFLKVLFGPESLMPRKQDFIDMVAHVKWFFNKGPRPQFDRWTYWEKFDYLAVFWGMFIIGFSGLILWFPTFFSVLPGWMINLATIVHSDEALLATGFIFAVHFFNTHFRADRFPMDMVIFSGTITKEEMLQERKPWYERLVKSGRLAQMEEENGKYAYKIAAKVVGFAMLLTGLIFLFMIIYALIRNAAL